MMNITIDELIEAVEASREWPNEWECKLDPLTFIGELRRIKASKEQGQEKNS